MTSSETVSESYEQYRFNESANTLYHFVWHEFCDWYLEMAKNDLYQKENPAQAAGHPAGDAACAEELSGAAASHHAVL